MDNKFHFSSTAWDHNNKRLTNQIFKLLPMYEEGEDWKAQQQNILLELQGYNDMFVDNPGFMVLISKLFALDHVEDQMIFRKLVFEALTELKNIEV